MIVLSACWSRKMPGPVDFSSMQAQVSIQIEVGSITEIPQRAREAFALVENAVDEQLGQSRAQIAPSAPASGASPVAVTRPPATNAHQSSSTQPSATRRYQSTRKALVTPAQLGLIDRLLHETNTDPNAVMLHYQVSSLDQMTCKNSSALIDELKARQTSTRP